MDEPTPPALEQLANGSSSAVLLEIAEALAAVNPELRRKVRFVWFSARSHQLLGANEYVNSLSSAELDAIRFMISVDSAGSPNFARFVYDSNNFPEQLFMEYFAALGLAVEPTPLDGRSGYLPFYLAGIPVGGVFGGAELIKTMELAAIYGGTAGEQFDPCFTLACDTSANVASLALAHLSDAVAHVLFLLAAAIDRPAPAPALTDWSLCIAVGLLIAVPYLRLRSRGFRRGR